MRLHAVTGLLLLLFLSQSSPSTPRVQVNDNRHAAGTLRGGVLTLHLEARIGTWYPDGDSAEGAEVPAFAEVGKAPSIPGPVIRVPAGNDVAMSIHNRVEGATLIVHGLHARRVASAPPDTLVVPSGETREVHFRLEAAGTYYYWGTTTGTGRSFAGRTHEDAQLSGAIIVDPPGQVVLADRVLIIGEWADTQGTEGVRNRNRLLLVVNGRSWPHTERLTYTVGDTVRLRVINASADLHPLHLHGFYYEVDSRGDGISDTIYGPADRDRVVTERLGFGRTMAMTWVPDRAGNWLLHCHVPQHFGLRGSLGMMESGAPSDAPPPARANRPMQGMNGLVVGITVRPLPGEEAAARNDGGPRRHLRLLVRVNRGSTATRPLYGFALQEGPSQPPPDSGHHSGPTLVLTRDEPVSIMVVNYTPEATSVHWHGIELESYFDGVAGFSGTDAHLAPVIAPGDSFEARFTPPHAGTFIYHTHVDELRQEPAGLSGPLLVVDPGARYDTTTDRAILISSPEDPAVDARAILWNGSLQPTPLTLHPGVPMRLRFINITVGRPGMRLDLLSGSDVVTWRVVAKDGAARPENRTRPQPAHQLISIGETVDVEVTPPAAGHMRVEARTAQGRLLGTLPLRVIAAARP